MTDIKHAVSIDQFDNPSIERLFLRARTLRDADVQASSLAGKVLACLFYEPSTRTSSSFIAAMTRAGGSVIPITQGVQFSSVSKGETLEDTIVTLGQYADAIVLRHPEVGAAARAAAVSPVPVINAGDGAGEHPTQALLDLFTIQEECGGRLDELNVTFVGDLAHGRTVHSLAKLLARHNTKINLVSPFLLRLNRIGDDDPTYRAVKHRIGRERTVKNGLHEAQDILNDSDVIYMTRVQRERFTYAEGYAEVKDSCLLTDEIVAGLKPRARILHPFPRVNEIPTTIDKDPRAAYFRQIRNGLWVRMALLESVILGRTP
jgi:carbamoyl-phosphate synthase/aspartate carbamoyltransferase/dihydroorotase/carbamoyl-phosphate synthase/aspartate carbamoyltransferase